MIPADRLRTLRNDIPILDVVFRLHMPIKKRGARVQFRCPACGRFHTATNSSTNLARCFHCARNFNPIDLAMAQRRSTFLDAIGYLEGLLT